MSDSADTLKSTKGGFPPSYKGGSVWTGEKYIKIKDFDYLASNRQSMECEDKENLRICWDLVNAVTILGEIKTARFLMADSIWPDPGYGIMGFSYTVGDETLDMQIVSDSEGNDVYVLTIYHSESPRRETELQVLVKNGEPKDFARSSENVPLMNEGGRFVSAEERLMKIIEPLAIDKIEQKYFNQWLKGELYPHVNAFLGDIFDKFGIQDTDTFGILELLVTRAKRSLPHNLVKRYPGIDIDLEITRLQESLPSLQLSSRSLIQYNTLVSRGMVHWLRILKNQKNKLFVE